jgi:hypothetical protein
MNKEKIQKLSEGFLKEISKTDINSQINFIESINNDIFKCPLFISIINSLKELRSIKQKRLQSKQLTEVELDDEFSQILNELDISKVNSTKKKI